MFASGRYAFCVAAALSLTTYGKMTVGKKGKTVL